MSYESVIFNARAVLSDTGVSYRVDEAVTWLAERGIRLAVVAQDNQGEVEARLKQAKLDKFFAGRVYAADQINPSTHLSFYWDALKAAGMKSTRTLGIVSSVEGVHQARDGGISTIVGYAGGLSVDFTKAAGHEEGLQRAGATFTMMNYVQLPMLFNRLPSNTSKQWRTLK